MECVRLTSSACEFCRLPATGFCSCKSYLFPWLLHACPFILISERERLWNKSKTAAPEQSWLIESHGSFKNVRIPVSYSRSIESETQLVGPVRKAPRRFWRSQRSSAIEGPLSFSPKSDPRGVITGSGSSISEEGQLTFVTAAEYYLQVHVKLGVLYLGAILGGMLLVTQASVFLGWL